MESRYNITEETDLYLDCFSSWYYESVQNSLFFNYLNMKLSPIFRFVIITIEVSVIYKDTGMAFLNELSRYSPKEGVEDWRLLYHDL